MSVNRALIRETIRNRRYISSASTSCVLWDHLITIGHEYKYIWRRPLTVTKILYVALRYFTLASQLANHLILDSFFKDLPRPLSDCKRWFAFQVGLVQATLCLFNLIVFLRIYALYNKKTVVAALLATLYLAETALMICFGARLSRKLEFDQTCFVASAPQYALGFAMTPLVTQTIIWAMTCFKRIQMRSESRASRPIILCVFYDGALVFLTFFVLFLCPIPYVLNVYDPVPNMWSITGTVLCLGGCRIVINIQQLRPMGLVSPVTAFDLEQRCTQAEHSDAPMESTHNQAASQQQATSPTASRPGPQRYSRRRSEIPLGIDF